MKYFFGGLVVLIVSATLSMTTHATDVNNFTISRFSVRYDLSRDTEGRSRLVTTETITAEFPNFDQNHGLERAIPKSYDAHPTSLQIESVTKADGAGWEYTTYDSNDNLVVRIGNADSYVRNEQTFIIRYSQRDVTKTFADTGRDEFYWDVNGTEWKVPIKQLDATLWVNGVLTDKLTGDVACYRGLAGASARCELKRSDLGYGLSVSDLTAFENATVAIGFQKGTFSPYQQSLVEKLFTVWWYGSLVVAFIGFLLMGFLAQRYDKWTNRRSELGTIAPEYLPPKDTSLAMAASVIKPKGSLFTAQLIDLAVRSYIRIYQTRKKSLFRTPQYDLEIIRSLSDLKPEEREILTDMFGADVTVGQRLEMKKLVNNSTVAFNISDNDDKIEHLAKKEYGLREKNPYYDRWFKKFGWIVLIISIITLNPVLLVTALVSFICASSLWPLSDKGLDLARYMRGLKMYIGVAETRRLQLLQSPEGALKLEGENPADAAQLVKLYERALPYAVLFGQEKEWTKHIGQLYESAGQTPGWYVGHDGIFSAAAFTTGMNGLSYSSSYSSANSSSSGGSSGGGSSGGGGGGGGGGGW